MLSRYVLAAMREAELITGRAIGETVYRLTLDRFPDLGEPILIPRPPLVSIDSLTYYDTNGDSQTLDVNADLQVDTDSEPGRIWPAVSTAWPDTQTDRINSVVITFTAGSADDVDPEIIQAIALAVAGWFENREDTVEGSVAKLPNGFDRLCRIATFRDRDLTKFLDEH